MQPVAILLGLFGLAFFSLASAYYLRNRRIALEARERLRQASTADVDAVRPEGSPRAETEGNRVARRGGD